MTSRVQILTNSSSRGLKRARAAARRLSRRGQGATAPVQHEPLVDRFRTKILSDGISAPPWMRAALWILPILGATGWLLSRISDWMVASALTGTMAAPMVTALCFKTAEMKRLISQMFPLLLLLCGLSFGQSFLVASIVEAMRETGIIVPGHARGTAKGARR